MLTGLDKPIVSAMTGQDKISASLSGGSTKNILFSTLLTQAGDFLCTQLGERLVTSRSGLKGLDKNFA